jgi:hypothetical protein
VEIKAAYNKEFCNEVGNVPSKPSVNNMKQAGQKKKKTVVLSPLANYTDRVIAAGQRS